MAPRKNGNTYRGGSTIIGPGGRWPEAAEPEHKAAPTFKRFSGDGNAEKLEAARVRAVDEARVLTLKARAARESLERRMAKLAAANVTTRAKADKVALVESRPKAKSKRKTARTSPSEYAARLKNEAEAVHRRVEVTIKPRTKT